MTVSVKLNTAQLDRLSEVLGNLSLVVLASLVFPTLIAEHHVDTVVFWTGIVASIGCAYLSLVLLKGSNS